MEFVIICRGEVWTCQKSQDDKACQSSMVGRLVCWCDIHSFMFLHFEVYTDEKYTIYLIKKWDSMPFCMNWEVFLLSNRLYSSVA